MGEKGVRFKKNSVVDMITHKTHSTRTGIGANLPCSQYIKLVFISLQINMLKNSLFITLVKILTFSLFNYMFRFSVK